MPTPGVRRREVHDPVRLPRLAVVVRERLLPPRCRRRHSRPGEAHADRTPLERVVALEDADVARERADHRRIEQAGAAAVGPVDRPQAGRPGRRSGRTCRRSRRRTRCRTRPRSRARREAAAPRPSRRTRPTRRSRRGASRGAGSRTFQLPHPEVEVRGRRTFLHCRCSRRTSQSLRALDANA